MKDQLLQQIMLKSFAMRSGIFLPCWTFASFLFHHPFIQKCWFFAIFLSFLGSLFTSTSQVVAPAYQSAPRQTLEWAYHFHRHGPSGQKGPNPRYKHEEHSGGYKPWELETMVMRLWENGGYITKETMGWFAWVVDALIFRGRLEIGDWSKSRISSKTEEVWKLTCEQCRNTKPMLHSIVVVGWYASFKWLIIFLSLQKTPCVKTGQLQRNSYKTQTTSLPNTSIYHAHPRGTPLSEPPIADARGTVWNSPHATKPTG